tara:strand:- start:2262 stop:2672 length:411 start_codon:yes stop_codon:yes gene_type:complete
MKDKSRSRPTKRPRTTGRPNTAEGKRLKQLLDELHSREQQDSAQRAEDILKLIRSRQEQKLPRLEDTIDPHQIKRLKPLAWLIENQSYTTEEIQMVCLINEQRLARLRDNDAEALQESGVLDGLAGIRYNKLKNKQ